MSKLDLSLFAEARRKIPANFLVSRLTEAAAPSRKKVLFSFIIDFYLIFSATMFMKGMMDVGLADFMMGSLMKKTYFKIPTGLITAAIFPLMYSSYLFFSYYFSGRTLGMYLTKLRVDARELNLADAFQCMVSTMKSIVTFGVRNPGYKIHDHLYHKLMIERDRVAPDLVHAIEVTQEEALSEEKIAA